jgi:hypothetical protein
VSAALDILERLLEDLRGPLYVLDRRPTQTGVFAPEGYAQMLLRPTREKVEAAIDRARADLVRARLNGEAL